MTSGHKIEFSTQSASPGKSSGNSRSESNAVSSKQYAIHLFHLYHIAQQICAPHLGTD